MTDTAAQETQERARGFSSLSATGKVISSLAIAVGLSIVCVAERDIQRRPDDQVRGSKALWRLLSLNALGAIGYLKWGRRAAQQGG